MKNQVLFSTVLLVSAVLLNLIQDLFRTPFGKGWCCDTQNLTLSIELLLSAVLGCIVLLKYKNPPLTPILKIIAYMALFLPLFLQPLVQAWLLSFNEHTRQAIVVLGLGIFVYSTVKRPLVASAILGIYIALVGSYIQLRTTGVGFELGL